MEFDNALKTLFRVVPNENFEQSYKCISMIFMGINAKKKSTAHKQALQKIYNNYYSQHHKMFINTNLKLFNLSGVLYKFEPVSDPAKIDVSAFGNVFEKHPAYNEIKQSLSWVKTIDHIISWNSQFWNFIEGVAISANTLNPEDIAKIMSQYGDNKWCLNDKVHDLILKRHASLKKFNSYAYKNFESYGFVNHNKIRSYGNRVLKESIHNNNNLLLQMFNFGMILDPKTAKYYVSAMNYYHIKKTWGEYTKTMLDLIGAPGLSREEQQMLKTFNPGLFVQTLNKINEKVRINNLDVAITEINKIKSIQDVDAFMDTYNKITNKVVETLQNSKLFAATKEMDWGELSQYVVKFHPSPYKTIPNDFVWSFDVKHADWYCLTQVIGKKLGYEIIDDFGFNVSFDQGDLTEHFEWSDFLGSMTESELFINSGYFRHKTINMACNKLKLGEGANNLSTVIKKLQMQLMDKLKQSLFDATNNTLEIVNVTTDEIFCVFKDREKEKDQVFLQSLYERVIAAFEQVIESPLRHIHFRHYKLNKLEFGSAVAFKRVFVDHLGNNLIDKNAQFDYKDMSAENRAKYS
jgi:hypothetical protein